MTANADNLLLISADRVCEKKESTSQAAHNCTRRLNHVLAKDGRAGRLVYAVEMDTCAKAEREPDQSRLSACCDTESRFLIGTDVLSLK